MTSSRISHVHCEVLTGPLPRPFVAGSVEVVATEDVIAAVVCEDGTVGLGYSTAFSRPSAARLADVVHELADQLSGASTDAWRLDSDTWVRSDDIGLSGLAIHATGILSMALLDAHAVTQGCTVSDVVGTGPTAVPCYLSGGSLDATDDQLALLAREAEALGVHVLKVKVDGRAPDEATRRVEHLVAQLPPQIALAVDANQTFTVAGAAAWVAEFPNHRIAWLEEPVGAADVGALQELSRLTSVPLAAGETTFGPTVIEWIVASRATDAVVLNPARIGGPHRFLDKAAAAAEASIDVHGHVLPQVTAQLLGADFPTALVEYLPWWDRLFEPEAYEIAEGCVRVTGAETGLGFSSDLRTSLVGS